MTELHTISLFVPLEIDKDRTRISVISRPTLDDGVTPDERIKKDLTHHEWIKDFAPPPKLVGSYKRGEISWKEYQERYILFLRSPEVTQKVREFAKRCKYEKITLACIEESSDFCHRRLLAEELQQYEPELIIVHK